MPRDEDALRTQWFSFDACLQEVRYSFRSICKAPAFAASTITVLAITIGANSALFSVLYGVLLRPLPYRDADRLVVIDGERRYAESVQPVPARFRLIDLKSWRDALRTFDATA